MSKSRDTVHLFFALIFVRNHPIEAVGVQISAVRLKMLHQWQILVIYVWTWIEKLQHVFSCMVWVRVITVRTGNPYPCVIAIRRIPYYYFGHQKWNDTDLRNWRWSRSKGKGFCFRSRWQNSLHVLNIASSYGLNKRSTSNGVQDTNRWIHSLRCFFLSHSHLFFVNGWNALTGCRIPTSWCTDSQIQQPTNSWFPFFKIKFVSWTKGSLMMITLRTCGKSQFTECRGI